MVISGFSTRLEHFFGASTMAVTDLIQHADDPFGTKEKAFLDLAGYVVLLVSGSGKYSLYSKLS